MAGNVLVQPLFDGAVDVIGDVHGEIDALRALLGHLGYDNDGVHREGRRLIFLGDLTDRGTNSPAVVRPVGRLLDQELERLSTGAVDVEGFLAAVGMSSEEALATFVGREPGAGEPGASATGELALREGILDKVGRALARQNASPVKRLTSGPERRV